MLQYFPSVPIKYFQQVFREVVLVLLWCCGVMLLTWGCTAATVHYNSLYNHQEEKVHFISSQPPLNTPSNQQ